MEAKALQVTDGKLSSALSGATRLRAAVLPLTPRLGQVLPVASWRRVSTTSIWAGAARLSSARRAAEAMRVRL